MKTIWINRFVILLIFVLGSALTACSEVHTEATYANVTYDERVEQADTIVVGKVTNISESLWNQDSGEYWEEKSGDGSTIYTGISYTTFDIEVSQFIVGDADVTTITVTTVGESPFISEAGSSQQNELVKIGDEVVVFAQHTELAWRGGGTRSILQLMGVPNESYLVKGTDGLYHSASTSPDPAISLENLINEITERRSTEGS